MSFYRGLFVVVVMLGVAILSTGAFAAVPLTMTHQGRLLDATDKPVNGFFDITYRIFEVPTGGSPLWTELHASVPVADGLFSALLGSTVPLSADVLGNGGGGGGGGALSPRYLEVSVGGTTLTPRMQLSSVPSALSAGHVSGDIETAPGQFTVTNTGGATTGALRMKATPDSAVTHLEDDPDNDGSAQSKIDQAVTHLNSKIDMARDVNNDGVMDMSVEMATDNDSASFRLNGLPPGIPVTGTLSMSASGTGARSALEGRSGSTTGTIRMMAAPDSASEVMEKKGLNAVNVKLARTISSPPGGLVATDALDMDSDDDGVMDKSISSSCDATGARLKVNNLGSSGQDGVELLALPTGSSVAIKEKGTGADPRRSITSTTNPETATTILAADLDGDGVADVTCADSVGATGATRKLHADNLGSSGQDGVELSARPSGASFRAINTKGTGEKLRCSGSANPEAATILLEADLDGDGVMDVTSADSVDATGASRKLEAHNLGSSGEDGVEMKVSPARSSVAIKTKGTGADNNRAASIVCAADLDGDGTLDRSVSTTADSTTAGIAIDEPGVHITAEARKGWDGTIKGKIAIDESGVHRVLFDSDGNGFLSGKVGIGVDVPTHLVDVTGGAYCDGTNWVNASDRNSKENFTAVDGNELLYQIAQLSITRWNYKGNNQAEHIGPTAQDFKAAFGVGADDKSISTIDPSGIALAAIKALNGKMQELNAKTTQLEDQAQEITELKAELDAIKAMLHKQVATKN